MGKQSVMGVLQRAKTERDISRIRVQVVQDTTRETLHGTIKANVQAGCEVFTTRQRVIVD